MSGYHTPERQLSHYAEAKNDGLEQAALHLQRKADKMKVDDPNAHGAATANMMARIYEAEAEEILALRASFKA